MNGTPTLSTETAEVTTAAVEIKTLTVRGKQVTLAVFRQLEEKRLISEDGYLNGLAWGRVNYHPGKCSDGPEHMHVVWQDGTDLRRARVATKPAFGIFECAEADQYVSVRHALRLFGDDDKSWAKVLDEWASQQRRTYKKATTFALNGFPHIPIDVDPYASSQALPGIPPRSNYESRAAELAKLLALDPAEDEAQRKAEVQTRDEVDRAGGYCRPPRLPLNERIEAMRRECAVHLDRTHEAAQAIHDYLVGETSPDALAEDLLAAVADEDARRKRITSITATLAALPQLFIAV